MASLLARSVGSKPTVGGFDSCLASGEASMDIVVRISAWVLLFLAVCILFVVVLVGDAIKSNSERAGFTLQGALVIIVVGRVFGWW